ncbi:hydroxymethylglutaryl-CoA lyase [Aciditerrimonas ferrireducens]|jgi:hydroxymethylglutaryl-CoA lyase|uniref:Hydroxymethylglutaryl-CoA lyase n=1 Tax=Aciditerrimonas ferrireducens TaxID=667306 RepID=A0ABV6C4R0_9ACTN|nr:hydroxymethylglutaryl-CoA lyase [Aciditerrimonas ferrireducens]MCK4177012.1 hydroxymethylglutaryl-CoA lyase [Aciditerrimonas ferrireducens]
MPGADPGGTTRLPRDPSRFAEPLPGLPEAVTVYEVGLRDGLQDEPGVVPTPLKVALARRLIAAGLAAVEVTSFVRPDRVPQLADAEAVLTELADEAGVRLPVLVPNPRGLERALRAGAREVAVFLSATETFSQRNLGCDRATALARASEVAEGARRAGVAVRGYVSMCFGDPWEGSVDRAAVVETVQALLAVGCREVSLGDTIGVATPGQVRGLVEALGEAGVVVERLALHCHDTYGQALANVLAGLLAGVRTVDSAIGGLGGCPFAEGAAGNLATEELVWMLEGLGIRTGVDLGALVATNHWLRGQLGRPLRSRVAQALGG